MRNSWLVLILAVVCLASAVALGVVYPWPPDKPANVLDVAEWYGNYTITITLDESASWDSDGDHLTAQRHIYRYTEGKFHLDHTSAGGDSSLITLTGELTPAELKSAADQQDAVNRARKMMGLPDDFKPMIPARVSDTKVSRTWYNREKPTATVVVDDELHKAETSHTCLEERDGTDSIWKGHADITFNADFRLAVDTKEGMYGIAFPREAYASYAERTVPVTEVTKTWSSDHSDDRTDTHTAGGGARAGSPTWGSDPGNPLFAGRVMNQKLPTDAAACIQGSATFEIPFTPHDEHLKKPAQVVFTWCLTPTPPEDVELIIEPTDAEGYKTWRPKGSQHETEPGALLGFKTKLQLKGGGTPKDAKLERVVYRLEEVSQEPGICMNYPQYPGKDTPDLKFRQISNRLLGVQDDEKTAGAYGSKVAIPVNVESFDYGAFGKIYAIGELESGRKLTAHYKLKPEQLYIRIPDSRDDSHIADDWRKSHKADGADNSDEDNLPMGDKRNGDGLTLFEEYRGVAAGDDGNVSIFDLDPHKKDLFIINDVGGTILPAVRKFAQISNLKVHPELHPNNARKNVINFNNSWAHVADQHAILVTPGSGNVPSHANGGPGPPKAISELVVGFDSTPASVSANRDVIRELLKCCNVYPHGDTDVGWQDWSVMDDPNGTKSLWRVLMGPTGIIAGKLGNAPIRIFRESNPTTPITPPFDSIAVFVGSHNGRFSGDEDCIMRPDFPVVYEKAPNQFFFTLFDETHGWKLCTTALGHSTNKDPRGAPLVTRYSKAQNARGDCQDQILVNDALQAPKR